MVLCSRESGTPALFIGRGINGPLKYVRGLKEFPGIGLMERDFTTAHD